MAGDLRKIVVSLDDLVDGSASIGNRQEATSVLVRIAAVQARLAAYLVVEDDGNGAVSQEDHLLDATQAAARLGVTRAWLYRHKLPFAVRLGRRVRFSAKGIDRYINRNL